MKLALLLGLNYEGTAGELSGCINDVVHTRDMLLDKYDYSADAIRVLTDHTPKRAIKKHILQALHEIGIATYRTHVSHVWISYSGHGSYAVDQDGDEHDGHDEVIVPLDYKTSGYISDDEIHRALTLFHHNTKVFLCWDCCHSGTATDLPFRYDIYHQESRLNEKTLASSIVMLSGSRDDQLAAESWSHHGAVGAMTSTLLMYMRDEHHNFSWFDLLRKITLHLETFSYSQKPQLTSSRRLNISSYPSW